MITVQLLHDMPDILEVLGRSVQLEPYLII